MTSQSWAIEMTRFGESSIPSCWGRVRTMISSVSVSSMMKRAATASSLAATTDLTVRSAANEAMRRGVQIITPHRLRLGWLRMVK